MLVSHDHHSRLPEPAQYSPHNSFKLVVWHHKLNSPIHMFTEPNILLLETGKIFVCLWLGGGRYDRKDGVSRIALKLSPDRNIELREQFSAVTPAYHWNKTHWSDVYYEEVNEAIVKGLIKESYQLIASKLPKSIRSKYLSVLD